MQPGSDEAYRDQLESGLPYHFNNPFQGKHAKRSIEGPQVCTQANALKPRVIKGKDFVAIEQSYTCTLAAPGKNIGSKWTQTLVFPEGKLYFLSSDSILSRKSGEALFCRQDMSGHLKHEGGDNFSEDYLSYHGKIPASEGEAEVGGFDGYQPLVAEILRFFKTRIPPVSAAETIELSTFMEAADESKRRGGQELPLAEVFSDGVE